MSSNGKQGSLARAEAELYEVWDELRVIGEGFSDKLNKFSEKVQKQYEKRRQEKAEELGAVQKMVMEIERKRYNLEALRRGKKLPFPETKRASREIVVDAKKMIGEKRAPVAVSGDDEVDQLLDSSQELAEEELAEHDEAAAAERAKQAASELETELTGEVPEPGVDMAVEPA